MSSQFSEMQLVDEQARTYSRSYVDKLINLFWKSELKLLLYLFIAFRTGLLHVHKFERYTDGLHMLK